MEAGSSSRRGDRLPTGKLPPRTQGPIGCSGGRGGAARPIAGRVRRSGGAGRCWGSRGLFVTPVSRLFAHAPARLRRAGPFRTPHAWAAVGDLSPHCLSPGGVPAGPAPVARRSSRHDLLGGLPGSGSPREEELGANKL